jgi:hypothetical protein
MPRAHYHQTPIDLDLYMFIKKIELKKVNVKFQLEVGHWASRNDLARSQDLRNNNQMLVPKFMNNLQQALRNNTWPRYLTNQNYKSRFKR